MNISLFEDDEFDDELPRVFCHHEEMKNLCNYLYLQHQGALNGKISGNDPCEDSIIAISPKVFCLLMLARYDLVFSPTNTSQDIGVLLEWNVNFGRLCVYSKTPSAWNTPHSGSEHIGLNFVFENISAGMLDRVRAKFPNLHMISEPTSAFVNVAMDYKIEDGCHLNNISSAIYQWLNRLYEVESYINSGHKEH